MSGLSQPPLAPASPISPAGDADALVRLGHEIRTPLNAIVGLCHLCMQTRLDEQQRQYIGKILTSAHDLLRVCQHMPGSPSIEDMPNTPGTPGTPVAPSPAPDTLPDTAPESSRVLLVEDNEINQEIASELLTVAGVDVDVAANGQEALEAVARTPYALIFMDVQMPVMDGLEATRRLREQGCTIPIIAMTAHAGASDMEASRTAGMNAHLTKPLEPEALFATIHRWMPMRRPAHSAHEGTTVPHRSVLRLPDAIEGFNLNAGLAAVANNATLYASLLQKFATRHTTIAQDIVDSLQKNDMPSAIRLAHTVKGIAANLGATTLSEAADTLERTLLNDPSMATPHLKMLITRLDAAVAAVNTALAQSSTHEDSTPAQDPTAPLPLTPQEAIALGNDIVQAIAHMENDWTGAYATSQRAQGVLAGTQYTTLAQDLLSAVEDFEADTARQYAQALADALR